MASTYSAYSKRHHPWRNGARWTASRDKKFKLRLVAPAGSDRPNRLVLLDDAARMLVTDVVRLNGPADPVQAFALARIWWINRSRLEAAGVGAYTFELDCTQSRPRLTLRATFRDRPGSRTHVPAGFDGISMRRDEVDWSCTAQSLCDLLHAYARTHDNAALCRRSSDLVLENLVH